MVDLETMGNGPNAAIVAIGAVEVDFAGKSLGETFYRVVSLESSVKAGMVMDASTVLWWLAQSDEARAELIRRDHTVPLETALQDFDFYIGRVARGFSEDLCVWGNGATFDNVILSSAYRALDRLRPWSFRHDRCYRTLRNIFPWVEFPPSDGVAHNALHDAVWQAEHLLRISEELCAPAGPFEVVLNETLPNG